VVFPFRGLQLTPTILIFPWVISGLLAVSLKGWTITHSPGGINMIDWRA
jgi:hypothetical protein